MSGITSYLAYQTLNAMFGSETWVKLHIGDPGTRGEDNPARNTVRKAIDGEFVDCFTFQNSNDIFWAVTGYRENYTHISIWNDETDGRALWSGPMSKTVAVNADDELTLATSTVMISLT